MSPGGTSSDPDRLLELESLLEELLELLEPESPGYGKSFAGSPVGCRLGVGAEALGGFDSPG